MEEYIEHQVKSKAKKFVTKFVKVLFYIIAGVVFLLLFAYVFMYLWNWLMPEIFGLTTLTYWQAGGLLVLAKIIFGGFGNGGSSNKKKCKKEKSNQPLKGKLNRMCRDDFSKWKFYDEFWKEEGEQAY
ncbi:hypothetical protein D9O36_06430, partial [Zobellia amurskyensis]